MLSIPTSFMSDIQKPSLLLLMLEGRAIYELGAFSLVYPWLTTAPKGDGHPVMVFPGFMTSDTSTLPMRTFLKGRGYATYGWGLGRNYGRGIDPKCGGIPDNSRSLEMIDELYAEHGRRISLVGWSLGGIYAREIARLRPDKIRQVITMGSPFNGKDMTATSVSGLFERISGHSLEEFDHLLDKLQEPPPVPITAIYTRTDGIAAWECCIEATGEETENIGVLSSHFGLGHNPVVLWLVAERLAQTEGAWQPFDRRGLKSLFYTTPRESFGIW